MTTRALVLPAVLAALIGPAGCAPPEEASKSDDKPKAEAKKPKTPAEVLVGTWVMVESEPAATYPECTRMQFTTDGHWSGRTAEPMARPQSSTGTYTVAGNTLLFHLDFTDAPNPDDRRHWEVQIETLTENKLVTVGPPNSAGRRDREVYKRIASK